MTCLTTALLTHGHGLSGQNDENGPGSDVAADELDDADGQRDDDSH